MTDDAPTCATGCGQPPVTKLCRDCTRYLKKILAELPARFRDLEQTLARQANTGSSGGGHGTKKSEHPLPYDDHASNLARMVHRRLGLQIEHLWRAPLRRVDVLVLSTVKRMQWLYAHRELIAVDPKADVLYLGITSIAHKLRVEVDNHERRFAGTCTAKVIDGAVVLTDDDLISVEPGEERECGAALHVRANADLIRCSECGATYTDEEHKQRILGQSVERLELISAIDALIADAKLTRPGTVMQWLKRDNERVTERVNVLMSKLVEGEPEDIGPDEWIARETEAYRIAEAQREFFAWAEDAEGRPLYRMGDFLDRAKRTEQRTKEIS